MSFLYFAYGSNLLRQRLLLDNPSAKFVAVGKLQNYQLRFSCIGIRPEDLRWRGGAATIVEKAGQSVWGCVWRLDDEHKASLDRQEGVYIPRDVLVQKGTNTESALETCTCRTYQLPKDLLGEKEKENRPSPMYMDVIIRGAVQNNLPEDYVKYLREIPTNNRQEELELYKKIIRLVESETS